MTWPFTCSSKCHSPKLFFSLSFPCAFPDLLHAHLLRRLPQGVCCASTPHPHAPLYHTTSGTARSSLNRPKEGPPDSHRKVGTDVLKVTELWQCQVPLFEEGGICPPDSWAAGVVPSNLCNVATTPLSQSTGNTKSTAGVRTRCVPT